MTWVERDGNYECHPYKVVWNTRGWDAWHFSPTDSGRLGRELTLAEAKQACEMHARKVAA